MPKGLYSLPAQVDLSSCPLVTGDLDEHKIPDIPLQPQKQDWGNVSVRANIV